MVAESVFPYKKTLTGVFKRQLGNQYVVEDESGRNAAVLTMVCADGEKDITVTLPSGVIPDEADIRVTGYKDNKCTFQFARIRDLFIGTAEIRGGYRIIG